MIKFLLKICFRWKKSLIKEALFFNHPTVYCVTNKLFTLPLMKLSGPKTAVIQANFEIACPDPNFFMILIKLKITRNFPFPHYKVGNVARSFMVHALNFASKIEGKPWANRCSQRTPSRLSSIHEIVYLIYYSPL